jgi:plasmid stabilization system protein ParE
MSSVNIKAAKIPHGAPGGVLHFALRGRGPETAAATTAHRVARVLPHKLDCLRPDKSEPARELSRFVSQALRETKQQEIDMPRGDKSSYTGKQKRKAEHIEEGYEKRGVSHEEAERRAWATVNKESGGGKKSGSGRGKKVSHASSRKGGRIGGHASANRSAAARSRSAKKAAATRKRRSA